MPYKNPVQGFGIPRWTAIVFSLLLPGSTASAFPAPDESPDDFKVEEVTAAAWLVDSGGTIQANGTPVDLISDLGVSQQQPTFFGRLIVKPGPKHRIFLEGTPFHLTGLNTVNRTIVYHGQTFDINDTLRSMADLNYFLAGYQYDVVSGSSGHLGLSVAGAYLGTTGTITSVTTGTTASKAETIGIPLAGVEGRIFPMPRHKILMVEGDIRGMAFGDYGHYWEATGSGGITIGHITLLAGYRSVNPDIHASSSSNPAGVDAHLKGPVFSVQFRL